MRIRDFTGSDYEGAAKLVGACRHAARGTRSYWYGADELCALMAASDAALVAEEAGTPVGIALVKSAAAPSANRELQMHWMQQRQVIGAVSRTLGIDVRHDADATAGPVPDRLARALGAAARELVPLFEVAQGAPAGTAERLADAALAWLVEHGAQAQATRDAIEIREGNSADDEQELYRLIDGHAERQGHPFLSLGFHVEREGRLVAGVIAWAQGGEVHIDTLAVDESLRRQGVGTALVRRVEEAAREAGVTRASVETFSFQAPDFYPRLGYREVARRTMPDGSEYVSFEKDL